jgi:hypothetical protein
MSKFRPEVPITSNMTGTRTAEGWEVRLKPQGFGRFLSAGFLAFWLCGWAIGEGFALWFLIKGGQAVLTGTSPEPGKAPLEVGPALAMGGFLLVWLAFWTLGGVAAFGALLHSLWAEDRLVAGPGGLTVRRIRGPFRRTRVYARDRVRGLTIQPPKGRLVLETDRDLVVLSELGTPEERVEAVGAIRSELMLQEPSQTNVELPQGWEEVVTPEGERAVTQSPRNRKIQAGIAAVAALGMSVVALVIINQAMTQPGFIPGVILSFAATAALAWGAAWLAHARTEYRIGSGFVTFRRRFRSTVRDLFETRRLELTVRSDSDGDEWYGLDGLSSDAPAPAPSGYARWTSKERRTIVSVLHDPIVPRRLGAWMARAATLPLTDATTPEARRAEIVDLTVQLEQAGPLGRFAARLVQKAQKTRDNSA